MNNSAQKFSLNFISQKYRSKDVVITNSEMNKNNLDKNK